MCDDFSTNRPKMLGSILTPILLATLAAIAFFGIFFTKLPETDIKGAWDSFKIGIFQGYQTMDLLAAFFFSTFVIRHLKTHSKDQSDSTRATSIFFRSSLIGAGLLAFIYFLLVVLGSMYASELTQVPPQEMLGYVAQKALGSLAAPIVCACVILACLTTAIVLTSLFADFLKKEISKDRLSNSLAIICTLGFAFCTSTLEFSGIARYIGPLLGFMYPALIVLALLGIFHKLWGWRTIRIPFAATVAVKVLTSL
jgi:branched-chain amino acid:cation transporter, LIVCS family